MRNPHKRAFRKSLWAFHMNTGSCNACDIEILATLIPRYDAERFGLKLVGTPRHADLLIVTGTVTKKIRDSVLRVYAQMPDPKYVMVVGACGLTKGVFQDSYSMDGPFENYIPVDVNVPGCPPRPEAIIQGISLLWEKIQNPGRFHGATG